MKTGFQSDFQHFFEIGMTQQKPKDVRDNIFKNSLGIQILIFPRPFGGPVVTVDPPGESLPLRRLTAAGPGSHATGALGLDCQAGHVPESCGA